MRSKQYLQYIKSLGNKALYESVISEVKRMREFEEKYYVDIDEMFHDESKVEEYLRLSGYNEPLFFAINNYMRTVIENPNLTRCEEEEKECICPDRFSFKGTREELVSVLSQMMEYNKAEELSWKLHQYQGLIDEDEYIQVKKTVVGYNPKHLSLLREEWDYNINITALSLVAIALILDIKLKVGVVSSFVAVLGVNGQAIVRVSAKNAEKCLILEALLRTPHVIDKGVLKGTNCECVHNNFNCKYKEDGNCIITEDEVVAVLDDLSRKNVFTNIRGQYKYNF